MAQPPPPKKKKTLQLSIKRILITKLNGQNISYNNGLVHALHDDLHDCMGEGIM